MLLSRGELGFEIAPQVLQAFGGDPRCPNASMPAEQSGDDSSKESPFGLEQIDFPADVETRPDLQPLCRLVGHENALLAEDLFQERAASDPILKIGCHRGTVFPSDALHVFLIDRPRLAENAEVDVDQLCFV